METAAHEEVGIAKLLISKKVPLNEVDSKGASAIFFAMVDSEKSIQIIKMLLAAGADPKIVDRFGQIFFILQL